MATLLESQLDRDLAHQWSIYASDLEAQSSLEQLLEFVKSRVNTALPQEQLKKPALTMSEPSQLAPSRPVYKVEPSLHKCSACDQDGHTLSKCSTFLSWQQPKRHKFVKGKRFCYNCLSHSHVLRVCSSAYNCKRCGNRHHTLLHREAPLTNSRSETNSPPSDSNSLPESNSTPEDNAPANTEAGYVASHPSALLSTAVTLTSCGERRQQARALLGSGASITLVSEQLASLLKAKRHCHRLNIAGVTGESVSRAYIYIFLESLHPMESACQIEVKAHIVPALQSIRPPKNPRKLLDLPCIRGKKPIAGPNLGGEIDLLGIADVGRCTCGNPSLSYDRATIATHTIFGWALKGAIPDELLSLSSLHAQEREDPLDAALQHLWTLDQTPDVHTRHLSPDE